MIFDAHLMMLRDESFSGAMLKLMEEGLAAGDAVLYPSSSVHRVAEVKRGERLVAVSWIQSLVRDPDKRALLHELNQARETLLRERPDAAETRQVNHAYVNLVRMWSEV